MERRPAANENWAIKGNLAALVRETHTGIVVLAGDRAYKAKKPIATDFLDFTTLMQREAACEREVRLNRRLAPKSYLGVAHFVGPGSDASEPVIVMRRYADSARLASLVRDGLVKHRHLGQIAETLAAFHRDAVRGPRVDAQATVSAVADRWDENLSELAAYPAVSAGTLDELRRLVTQYISGRGPLFARRISEHRIVDGHADLLADDIFCTADGLAILDCLEFDDALRYVDGIDDAAFLAMDLEFLGREDLANFFLDEYSRRAADDAPPSLKHFYIAYRAVVRAKVDCVRVRQGHDDAASDATRHLDVALKHLRSATVKLILVSGGPGTGKTTLSRALADETAAHVISTDDVRQEMVSAGLIHGAAGTVAAGLYSPENVAAVYAEVLRRADELLRGGSSVVLDGTWRDAQQRDSARRLGDRTNSPMVELTCSLPLVEASARIRARRESSSDATPQIAAALAKDISETGHRIDTSRPLADSVAEAQQICCLAV
jgi:aminoglycoside phosphotransferase family enzyme/predicted kinase